MENFDQILDAPEGEVGRFQYAGFWIRAGAYLIDGILLTFVQVIIMLIIQADEQYISSIISLIMWIVYFSFMESSENQATLGKMAVSIKVGNIRGERLTLPNALGRYAAKFISGIMLCIGFMMVGWDEKKQGTHDKLADTYVFYVK